MPQLSIHAPLFDLTLYEEDGEILSVDWGWSFGRMRSALLLEAKKILDHYFDGEDVDFTSIPLGLNTYDSTEQKILQTVRTIPYGHTRTYHDLATAVQISADDAEHICLTNPFPILIPCHRVVKSMISHPDSDIGDYVGGDDIPVKRELLILEGIISN